VNGQVITWSGPAPNKSSGFIILYATVDGPISETQNVTNCVNATGVPPNGDNVTANSCVNITLYEANASVIKLDQTAAQPSPGGLVQFNITVTNTGNVSLNGTVNDTLPAGLTFESANPLNTSAGPSWNFTNLTPGSSLTYYINATVDAGVVNASVPVRNFTNCIDATGVPPNGDNVTASSCVNVTVYYPNVSVIKVAITPAPVSPGGYVEWRINVSNLGEANLSSIYVIDTLPPGFQYLDTSVVPVTISPDNRTMNWTLGPLGPGEYVEILLNSSVDPGVANGTYYNIVNVTGVPENGDNVTDSDNASVGIFAPAINVVKTASPTSILSGENVTYTLNITNTGAVNLTITAVDVLPADVDFLSASPSETSYIGSTLTWDSFINLSSGEWTVIVYNVTSNVTGTYVNNVTVTGVPPNGDNVTDADSASFTVRTDGDDDDDDDDGEPWQFTFNSTCEENTIKVTETGLDPNSIQAEIRIFESGFLLGVYHTDSNGEFKFSGCDMTINISVKPDLGKYEPGTQWLYYQSTVECSDCIEPPVPPECVEDGDCEEGYTCTDGNCTEAEEEVYECTSDGECKDSEFCDIPEGEVGGTCKAISACGLVENHTIKKWYECDPENPVCPLCPVGYVCKDNSCVTGDIECPETGLVGSTFLCNATIDDEPCVECDIEVVDPDGKKTVMRTDEKGQVPIVPLNEGIYNVSLLVGAQALSSIHMTSIKPPGLVPEAPPSLVLDEFCLPLLLLLLILLLLLWYLRRREIYAKMATPVPKAGKMVEINALSRKDDKPAKGVSFAIFHTGKKIASGVSNKFGRFSFTPKDSGEYVVKLNGQEKLKFRA
jgi:uncharacterized repeat protein (TIGR01451 family)